MVGFTLMETYDRIEADIAARRAPLHRHADPKLRRALVSALGLGGGGSPLPRAARVGVCRRGDVLIERLRIEMETPVPAHLYLPAGRRRPTPAVLFVPDHESGGKSDRQYVLMGQMLASRGIAALIPDPIGVGERAAMGHSDLKAGWLLIGLGPGLFGVQLAELLSLARYLAWREDIARGDRVGCAGHGTGGLLAMFLCALSDHMAAVAVSGCAGTFQYLSSAERKLCPCSIIPGILGLAEAEDVLATIAPKPVLLMAGLNDGRAPEQLAWRTLQRVRDAYGRRGANPSAVRLFVSPHERELDHGRRLAAAEFFAATFGLRFSGRVPAPIRCAPDGCLDRRDVRRLGTLMDMVERRLAWGPELPWRRGTADWYSAMYGSGAAGKAKDAPEQEGGAGTEGGPDPAGASGDAYAPAVEKRATGRESEPPGSADRSADRRNGKEDAARAGSPARPGKVSAEVRMAQDGRSVREKRAPASGGKRKGDGAVAAGGSAKEGGREKDATGVRPREGSGDRGRPSRLETLRRFVGGLVAKVGDRAAISIPPPGRTGPFEVRTAVGCATMMFKPGRGAPILVLGEARVPVGTPRPLAIWRFPPDGVLAHGVAESLVAAQRGAFLGLPPAAISAAILGDLARHLGGSVSVLANGPDGILALYAAFASREISAIKWDDAPCSFRHLPRDGPSLIIPGILALGDIPDLRAALADEIEVAVSWAGA
ncbi:MAG: hypothetical protein N3A38_09300 [Planctomycetota bacterium]|nr:hypothetical protein [Planctomycetota bacterium]